LFKISPIRKAFRWYFSRKSLPYWMVLVLDCGIVLLSCYLGSVLELKQEVFAAGILKITISSLVSTLLFCIAFRVFHTYSGILRYSTLTDLGNVAGASLLGTFLTYLFGLCAHSLGLPILQVHLLKGYVFLFLCTTFLMGIVRIVIREMYFLFSAEGATPVAVYGVRVGGIGLAESIRNSPDRKYALRAFVGDDDDMCDAYLLGRKVYRNGKGIGRVLKSLGVKVLFVSPLKNVRLSNNQEMINELIEAKIKIMAIPKAEEWDGNHKPYYQQLHEVEIEDLLPREIIDVDMNAIGSMLSGKRILITGAAGSIGSEMVRQVARNNPSCMILIDQAETPMHDIRLMMKRDFPNIKSETIVASITDAKHMESIFATYKPEYVFHAAAYKHVPMMEDNPVQAVRNNIYGTRVIADLAVKYGTKKFVMISTDKAVNPTNVMGCSKRICEIYCQSLNQAVADGKVKGETQFVTTRFGNVLGSNGSVIPLFKKQIKNGGPVTVTHPDIIRFFMLISEACKLVLEAGTMGKGGEIFVFDMGKPVKIVDLAKQMIKLSGAENVEIKFTGLREGEKLYEEVLDDKENNIPTSHPKIMVAKVREYDYSNVCSDEDELMKISYSHDDMAIVKKMKEMVPEFKSKVSKYEVLDN
jgi:FlaA1/EpsC-like NDP-sugar epimerase